MIVYASGNADGNAHSHTNLPVILAGGGGGKLQTGRFHNVDVDADVEHVSRDARAHGRRGGRSLWRFEQSPRGDLGKPLVFAEKQFQNRGYATAD